MSRRAVGILLRSRLAPSNLAPSFSRQRETPPPPAHVVPHRASSRQPLHTTNRSYAAPSEPEEKIDEAELARLLEQFEPPETPSAARGKADEPTTRGGKQKSRIEDYDAWHGWDGESDRPAAAAPPPGLSGPQRSAGDSGAVGEGKTSEVDRYIRDVLSGVAESKAARERAGEEAKAAQERAGEEAKAVERHVGEAAAAGTSSGENGVKRDELEHVKPAGSHRAESTLPDPFEANVSPAGPSASATVRKQPFSKNDMSLLAKKLQSRLDDEIRRLKIQKESVKQSLALRAKEFGKDAQVQFGLLGGKVNEVTGYNEIERLKQDVRERENDIARLREEAVRAKDAYDQAVTSRSVSQRDLNSLLERKHNWTDADISRFTHLVRSDHALNNAVTTSKEALKRAESEVDKAFTALLKSILERYHEEQVWSDKIRSVSTYGSLIVLLINLIVFLGAIAIVEPWKRRRLVRGLEERVKGMVNDVEHTVTGEFEEVKSNMATVAATLAELQAALAEGSAVDRIHHTAANHGRPEGNAPIGGTENVAASTQLGTELARESAPHLSSLLATSTLPMLSKVSSTAASFIAEQDPHRIDMAIVGTAGLVAGAAVTFLITTLR
ncbi:sensitivity to high expression protein she9 [Naganishia albida]|nr:sensitivity to high expression protein she9 [Naganishia albida]